MSNDGVSTIASFTTAVKKSADALLARLTSPGVGVAIGERLFRWFGFRTDRELVLDEIGSVLVVRVDQIGDAVLTSPALIRLRKALPAAEITLVTRPGVKALFETCPCVDRILTFDPDVSGRFPDLKRHWRALALARKNMWRRKFDLAISPRWNKDMYHALFLAYFSGARWRVAYRQPVDESKPGNDLNDLLTHAVSGRPDVVHEVWRNLEFLERLGLEFDDEPPGIQLWVDDEDELEVERALKEQGLDRARPLIAVAPGAREKKKIWPIERFGEVATWLSSRTGLPLVVVGSPEETDLGQRLTQTDSRAVVNLAGRISLRGVAALMDRCVLFVGNDSGPMHIAAARGVPVVDISTHPMTASDDRPMSPKRFGPWGVPHKVVRPEKPLPPCKASCRALESHCIKGVSTAAVISAITELLEVIDIRKGSSGRAGVSTR